MYIEFKVDILAIDLSSYKKWSYASNNQNISYVSGEI